MQSNHRECVFNPLTPHDALEHHFTSLKTDLIFLQLRVFEPKFPSRELRQQFAACSE